MPPVSHATAVNLAKALPERLQYFFKKFPTPAILGTANHAPNAPGTTATPSATSTLSNSNAAITPASTPGLPTSPFDAYIDPKTGKWHAPFYSLRRQAELVKLAQKHGVEDLMPFSIKGSAEKQRKREEHGLRTKGTGVGQRVKGKEWERTLKGR